MRKYYVDKSMLKKIKEPDTEFDVAVYEAGMVDVEIARLEEIIEKDRERKKRSVQETMKRLTEERKGMLKNKITLFSISRVLAKKEYVWFDGRKPFNVNIIGVRAENRVVDSFDDIISLFYRNPNLVWSQRSWSVTTDPGRYWEENPINLKGTAILAPGQYRGAFIIGKHRGKYEALVQDKPVMVYRDYNEDGVLDFDSTTKEMGMFGINIHRSSSIKPSERVNKWSAGCQVFQDSKGYEEFMKIIKTSAELYGNRFTYTLLEERDFDEEEMNEV